MTLVRLFSVMLMLAASVFTSGGAGLAQVCGSSHAAMAMRNCPCAQKERAARHTRPELERPSCCTIERTTSAPQPLATASAQAVTQLPAPVAAWVVSLPPPAQTNQVVAFRERPRSQGPPVFLKIRSLLI